jgi:hypothetical protein
MVALGISGVGGLILLGMAFWFFGMRASPGALASGQGKGALWLIIGFDFLLAVWLLIGFFLLLVEVKEVVAGEQTVSLSYWFLGQATVPKSSKLYGLYRGRVVRLGTGESSLDRMTLVVASGRIFSGSPRTLSKDGTFASSIFARGD